jgi:hypothetical protein
LLLLQVGGCHLELGRGLGSTSDASVTSGAAGDANAGSPFSQRLIAAAARLPSPMARITVAAPRTMSPPANTPGMLVMPCSSVTM